MAYTVKQLAARWKTTPKNIYALIEAERLKAFSISAMMRASGKRRAGTRISDDEVERWEKENGMQTAKSNSDNPGDIGVPTSIM